MKSKYFQLLHLLHSSFSSQWLADKAHGQINFTENNKRKNRAIKIRRKKDLFLQNLNWWCLCFGWVTLWLWSSVLMKISLLVGKLLDTVRFWWKIPWIAQFEYPRRNWGPEETTWGQFLLVTDLCYLGALTY